MADVTLGFKVKGGRPTIKKDPQGGLVYGVNMAPWLAKSGLVLDPARLVVRIFKGVTVGAPYVKDNVLCVMVSGLDLNDDAENYVTFHFYCTDGQHDDRTIYFEATEN